MRRLPTFILSLCLTVPLALSCKKESPKPLQQSPTSEPAAREETPATAPVTDSLTSPSNLPTVIPGTELQRTGDEIVVCGRLFHTGTRIVLWTDPGGYDAYRTERRFVPWAESSFAVATPKGPPVPSSQPSHPERFGLRWGVLNWPELELVRGGGWPLELLQEKVDQFVIHYDAVGSSKFCFRTLHDDRGLSIHFMLDIDGTIYQTLDLKERAFHATTSNPRSVGIEIANRGGYENDIPLKEFYATDSQGPYISFPARFGDGGVMVPGTYRPARPGLIRGTVNGHTYVMYDFTPQQYDALTKLTAALCTVLPKITLTYPKDALGRPLYHKLPNLQLDRYQGLLGHLNVQDDKPDPGPAFQWQRVIDGAYKLMTPEALAENRRRSHSPVRPGNVTPTPPVAATAPATTGKISQPHK
jgi:N-acetyl-anhydromuramyl-L-alanine amidase AmpD